MGLPRDRYQTHLIESARPQIKTRRLGDVLSRSPRGNEAALHISEHTLRNHLASIYGKLGIYRRLDLVLYGVEHRLGTLPS
jgi:DNA-binding NarL/FixJ family response regulator